MATRYGGRTETPQVSQWLNASKYLDVSYRNPRIDNTSVTLTANSSAHTFGAWTQVIASVPENTSMIIVDVSGIGVTTVNTASIISIGIGASGSETELFNFACGSATTALAGAISGLQFVIPVQINSGSRIAARLQSIVTGGKTATIKIKTFDANEYDFIYQPQKYDSLGVDLATSRGTNVAASNTYTEIVASTSNIYRGVCVIPSVATDNAGNVTNHTMSLGVGPSGSEVQIGSLSYQVASNETLYSSPNFFMPALIPAGSRIAVRQSSTATFVDASVIGVLL
jgi:hypothetical protein